VCKSFVVRRIDMSQKISLKDAELKAFTSAFQHGLWDIFIGCFLLQFVIAPSLGRSLGAFWSSFVFLPFFAVVFLVLWMVRKNVIVPRVGIVEFGAWRKKRVIRFNIVMVLALTVVFALSILSLVQFDSIPGWIHIARFSLVFLIGFCVAAYFLDFTRLYIYGVLIALSPIIGEVLYVYLKVPHHGIPITFGISAGLIILTGLLLFVRFLQDHPIPVDETATGERIE
jgi:hypothetical protein